MELKRRLCLLFSFWNFTVSKTNGHLGKKMAKKSMTLEAIVVKKKRLKPQSARFRNTLPQNRTVASAKTSFRLSRSARRDPAELVFDVLASLGRRYLKKSISN